MKLLFWAGTDIYFRMWLNHSDPHVNQTDHIKGKMKNICAGVSVIQHL